MTKSCTTLDLDAFDATRSAVEADPGAGRGSVQASTTRVDGARAGTIARTFTIETDEPSPLGGTDQVVDSRELLLASVGTCLTIGWVTHTARRGIDARVLRIDVTGEYDLRGIWASTTPDPVSVPSPTRCMSTPTLTTPRSRRSARRLKPVPRWSTTPRTPTPLTGELERAG